MKGGGSRTQWVSVGVARRIVLVVVLFVAVAYVCSGKANSPSPSNALTVALFGAQGFNSLFLLYLTTNHPTEFLPVTVSYYRAIAKHLVLSASFGYYHSEPLIGVPRGELFTPWVEIDWNSKKVGLDGFFIGLASSAEVDFFSGESPSFCFEGFGGAVGVRHTFWHHLFVTLEMGATGWNLNQPGSMTAAVMIQPDLGLGFAF